MNHQLEKMFVFVSQATPKEGHVGDYLRIGIASQQAAEGQPGLLQHQVLKPKEGNGPITLVSTWESEDDFKAWIKTEAFKKVHGSDVMQQVQAWTTDLTVLGCDVAAAWQVE